MMYTVTERGIKRLKLKKAGKLKGHKKGTRKDYVGLKYPDDDHVEVLHPTKGWRKYNISNPIVGV